MNVRWLKRALKSLEKSVIYSREEFGKKHAEEFLEKGVGGGFDIQKTKMQGNVWQFRK